MLSRQASQDDAPILSQLIYYSAPDALAATFDINAELSVLNFLVLCLLTSDGQYGFDNHWVAEIDNQVVGCLNTCHSDLPDSFHQATLIKLTNF